MLGVEDVGECVGGDVKGGCLVCGVCGLFGVGGDVCVVGEFVGEGVCCLC